MKKLLQVAALGVAGLMSANTIVSESKKMEISKIQEFQNFKNLKFKNRKEASSAREHLWIAIDSGCGQQYFLDLNDYSDDLAGLMAFQRDIAFFIDQKCKGAQAAANNQLTNFS